MVNIRNTKEIVKKRMLKLKCWDSNIYHEFSMQFDLNELEKQVKL